MDIIINFDTSEINNVKQILEQAEQLDEIHITFRDIGGMDCNIFDIKTIFKFVKNDKFKNLCDKVISIDLNKIEFVGSMIQYLYYFPKLKDVYYNGLIWEKLYEFSNEVLEFLYQKDCILHFKRMIVLIDSVIQFYKNHQDDTYYQHEMIKSGLFDDCIDKWDFEHIMLFFNDISYHRNTRFKSIYNKIINIEITLVYGKN